MAPKRKSAPAMASGTTYAASSREDTQSEQATEKHSIGDHEIPAALYEQLALLADKGRFEMADPTNGSSSRDDQAAMMAKPISQEDYVTVVVTPKLTFQLLKRPEWHVLEDITQAELRRGFLSRFPPALWLSSEKFSFKPALPPTSKLTEDMKTIFFKIVSDEVPDERVMLGIIRELERSYEAIIRRAVNESRSEALQEQLTVQEQAEEERREQATHVKELRREVKNLREQMQSIQKRLFLVEQEKDQLQREQHQMKDCVAKLDRQQTEKDQRHKLDQQDMRLQMESLRTLVEGVVTKRETEPSPELASRATSTELDKECTKDTRAVAVQTSRKCSEESDSNLPVEVTDISRRVDMMQQQFGALQAWMLQGSQLMSLMPAQQTPTRDQQQGD